MTPNPYLAILSRGTPYWNSWREDNPEARPDFRGLSIRGNLSRALFLLADFEGADLRGAFLHNADLRSANLNGADLREANLSGETNLRGAHLVRAKLCNANMSSTTLANADLTDADCFQTDFLGADLGLATCSNTNFEQASLICARFGMTKLIRANLRDSRLLGAYFVDTVIEDTDFSGATFGGTVFSNVDLSHVLNVDSCRHIARNSIDFLTLQRSPHLSKNFLRGCGLPEDVIIRYSMTARDDYSSCFISYTSTDEAFANKLHSDLQEHGIRCWYAPHDMKIGDDIFNVIDGSIRAHDKVLLIISKSSLKSTWVEREIKTALARELAERKPILFPIMLDKDVFKLSRSWAISIRETRHIGDFCGWRKEAAYSGAFSRLLLDLKNE